ncbi:hypothetical protein FSP39_001803 [Pinctada imbricata]|uniref:Kinesin motor domain-containing protein n=1 Tax=Pinctada imbricata TaxID=66713 RepID=A0AA88YPD7_PINIB|nr:hypothetical protein FSP39_001803 [Pinctada imbricata]
MTLSAIRKPSYADVARTPPRRGTSSQSDSGEKSCVKVVVRVRPENAREKEGTFENVVRVMNENVLVFDPQEQGSPHYGFKNRRRRDIRCRIKKDMKFAFDFVFGPRSCNADVYQQTTKKILDNLLEGYSCSVFAYGATGAGKTHTMLGNPSQPGVMFLTMVDLYQRIDAIQAEKTCDVAVSYLEVYNEQINDLLMGGKALPVRENASNGIVIQGLSLHKPSSADELLSMLQYGNERRTQHPTDANAESSRSHAVLQIFVRQRDRTANISTEVRVAKLCMVDLAGSERATVTKNRGKRFREGANINRSLLALGNVINALADPKCKGHVPYRDSKLTRILKDSLGGNCQTVMIAAVSPSSMTFEDTYNTLKYADRAKHIEAQLKKNVLSVDFHVSRYKQIIDELRTEIVELKGKVQIYEEGKLKTGNIQVTGSVEICRLRETLDGIYCKRLEYVTDYLKADLKGKDLKWKVLRKEKCLARPAILPDSLSGKYCERVKKVISSSQSQIKGFQKMKEESTKKIEQSDRNLGDFLHTIQGSGDGPNIQQETIKLCQEVHQAKLELTESEYKVQHLTKVVKYQEREIMASERLVMNLLVLLQKMKCHMALNSDLESDLKGVQTLIEGREVSFADQEANKQTHYDITDLLDFKSCCRASGKSDLNITAILKSPCTMDPLSTKTPTHRHTKLSTSYCEASRVLSLGKSRQTTENTRTRTINESCDNTVNQSVKMIQDRSTSSSTVLQSLEANVVNWNHNTVVSSQENSHKGGFPESRGGLNSQPCDVCKLYSCTCKEEVLILEQPCKYCKLFSCICSASTAKFAGHTPAWKMDHGQNLRKSAMLRHISDNREGQQMETENTKDSATNLGSVSTGDSTVKEVSKDSEDMNSTFTMEESNITDPVVRARTPIIHGKVCKQIFRTDVNKDLQTNFEAEFSRLADSPHSLESSRKEQTSIESQESSSMNSTFLIDKSSLIAETTASSIESQPSVLTPSNQGISSNKNNMKSVDSSTVTKNRNVIPWTESCNDENVPPTVVSSPPGKEQGSVPLLSHTITKSSQSRPEESQSKSHCARGLEFEEQTTSPKCRTWADVVMSPPQPDAIKRVPLRQVNNNNSAEERCKETVKKLQQFGIPSVYIRSKGMMKPIPDHIVWYYGEWQPIYATIRAVEFVEGLPDIGALDPQKRQLVIIDDLMSETDERITSLFTKKSHHRNISVIYIVQNVFHKGKENMTISLNSHYIVMFKNPRDASQITHLAKQMYPGNVKYMQKAFCDATSDPYGTF